MSAKELNIGDYVRTKDGRITKITKTETCCKINDSDAVYVENNNDLHILLGFVIPKEMIIKSSLNIIDLIEEGDLLKIEYYSPIYEERVTRLFEVTHKGGKFTNLENARCSFMLTDNEFSSEDKKLEPILKSIVTKEQFKSMEYKIGE